MTSGSFATFDTADLLPAIDKALEVCAMQDEISSLGAAFIGAYERDKLEALQFVCTKAKRVTLTVEEIACVTRQIRQGVWLSARLDLLKKRAAA